MSLSNIVSGYIAKSLATPETIRNVVTGSSFATINEALSKFKRQIKTSLPCYDALSTVLTSDAETISDVMLRESTSVLEAEHGIFTEVSDETAELIETGIKEAIHAGGTEEDAFGMTLTDSKGYLYNLCIPQGDFARNNGIIISMTGYPSKMSDAILYRSTDGKYHFNNVIRTANYVSTHAMYDYDHSILDALRAMCFTELGETPNTINECLTRLNDNIPVQGSTLLARISACLDDRSYVYNANLSIQENLNAYCAQGLPIKWKIRGGITSIWSLLRDILNASSLNAVISEVITAMQSFAEFNDSFFAGLADKYSAYCDGVKTFIHDARYQFLHGGLRQLGTFILNYARNASKFTDDDGTVSYSSNDGLVPQEYIAGLVLRVISAAVTLIGAIAMVFSRVVGGIFMAIGTIVSGIAQAVTIDARQRYCSIVDNSHVILPIAPYALGQCEIPVSMLDEAVISLFEAGAELVSLPIPGGYYIIGPSHVIAQSESASVDPSWVETYDKVIVKFYLSIEDHRFGDLRRVYTQIGSNAKQTSDLWWIQYDPQAPHGVTNIHFNSGAIHRAVSELDYDIYSAYASCGLDNHIMNVSASDPYVSSAADDVTMRDILAVNLVWWFTWLCYEASAPKIGVTVWRNPSNMAPEKWEALSPYIYPQEDVGTIATFLMWFAARYSNILYYATNITLPTAETADDVWRLGWGEHPEWAPSWVEFGKFAQGYEKYWSNITPGVTTTPEFFDLGHAAIDQPLEFPASADFAISPPKYNPKTFWFWVVLTSVVVVVATVAAVAVTLKAKQAIRQRRAINQARVEKAWSDLADDPTPENYQAYKKAVSKNNLWSHLIGGTRYDKVNYWNGDVRNPAEDSALSSGLFDSFRNSVIDGVKMNDMNNDLNTAELESEIGGGEHTIDDVYHLIRG